MLIVFTDSRGQIDIHADDQQQQVLDIVNASMIFPENFTLLYIDLSTDIEEVKCYSGQRAICSFGGAMAWNIYRQVAVLFPQIDRHLIGRPPLPPFTSVER